MAVSATDKTNLVNNAGIVGSIVDFIIFAAGRDDVEFSQAGLAEWSQQLGSVGDGGTPLNGCTIAGLLASLKNAVDALQS